MLTDIPAKLILLADDDPDDAEMFSLALGQVNTSVSVHHVITGSKVIEYLDARETLKPDMIFLDINMPEMDGWQCLRELKTNTMTKHIPVVMYTTSSHPRDKDIAMNLGAQAFITKPSDYNELKVLLHSITTGMMAGIKSAR